MATTSNPTYILRIDEVILTVSVKICDNIKEVEFLEEGTEML
jgi:hypothetical protein